MNIAVLGARGLVGSAIVSNLCKQDVKLFTPTSQEVDLLDYTQTLAYLRWNEIEQVYLCAAKVGGIHANKTYPVEFFSSNVQIGMNVVRACHESPWVKKLLNLGSTCIYPKDSPQPIKEEYLLSGKLEPSNEAYAIAKISILKLCEYYNTQYGTNFISAMPTNVYGPNDNYHPENSHVLPAIIRKVHEAKERQQKYIEVWGDGSPIREFIYSEDLAEALTFLMDDYEGSFVNIGTGQGVTIRRAYETAMEVIGYKGELVFDSSKPNGTPIKISDVTKINNLGWKSKITLEEGIIKTYEHLKETGFNWKEK